MMFLSEQIQKSYRPFKHIKSGEGTTTFLPLNTRIGRPVGYAKGKDTLCFTKDQARYLYKKGKSERIVNV